VIGTVVVEAVSFWLSNSYPEVWPILLGVLLLLVIMFRPAGLISLILGERERVGRFGRPPKTAQGSPDRNLDGNLDRSLASEARDDAA
jgi:branched-chain amino acid transport system permease protein